MSYEVLVIESVNDEMVVSGVDCTGNQAWKDFVSECGSLPEALEYVVDCWEQIYSDTMFDGCNKRWKNNPARHEPSGEAVEDMLEQIRKRRKRVVNEPLDPRRFEKSSEKVWAEFEATNDYQEYFEPEAKSLWDAHERINTNFSEEQCRYIIVSENLIERCRAYIEAFPLQWEEYEYSIDGNQLSHGCSTIDPVMKFEKTWSKFLELFPI
jgi:hypothetical protein